MQSKLFRIKRKWKAPAILVSCYDPLPGDGEIEEAKQEDAQVVRVGYDPEIVYVETPVEAFEEALVEKALDLIQDKPAAWKHLAWCIRQDTITAEVRKILHDELHLIVREALRQNIRELKKVTARMW